MKIFFSFIFITVLLFSQTINEQIHALEDASPEKRVELMNSIKRQLISMNQEKRMKTIGDLQKKLQVKHEETSVNEATTEEIHQENGKEKDSFHIEDKHQENSIERRHLERHEMQEQMMNSSHSEDSELHQSFHNHESMPKSEERNGDVINNHNNDFRR